MRGWHSGTALGCRPGFWGFDSLPALTKRKMIYLAIVSLKAVSLVNDFLSKYLVTVNSVILAFLFAELIRLIFFTRDWRYRFRESALPIKSWKKALIVMLLFLLLFPLINWIFSSYLSVYLASLGLYQISLLFLLLPVVYLWIKKRILVAAWGWSDLIPVLIIAADVAITYYLRNPY